jgi:hypothetical protein
MCYLYGVIVAYVYVECKVEYMCYLYRVKVILLLDTCIYVGIKVACSVTCFKQFFFFCYKSGTNHNNLKKKLDEKEFNSILKHCKWYLWERNQSDVYVTFEHKMS